ncbi:MAG: hypothetical protein HC859_03810 [Bacteroidia bacterium]|nr:hypothetical protein [Bacteroidia bacterium]
MQARALIHTLIFIVILLLVCDLDTEKYTLLQFLEKFREKICRTCYLENPIEAPMNTYQYADGNGNRYVVTPGTLEYIPITPRESSSGTYSGGEAMTTVLPEENYAAICTVFDKVLADKSQHISERLMMSGKLTKNSATGSWTIILRPGSPAQREVEEILARALSTKL